MGKINTPVQVHGGVVQFISEVSDSEQTKEQFCSKQELL